MKILLIVACLLALTSPGAAQKSQIDRSVDQKIDCSVWEVWNTSKELYF
jgi:hypothetical protein